MAIVGAPLLEQVNPRSLFVSQPSGSLFERWPTFFLAMSQTNTYVAPGYSTRVYYIISDTFKRPIEFKLLTDYNGEIKARSAFEAAYYPCKVVEFIEPKEGMSYMKGENTFDEKGAIVPNQQSHE